MTETAAETCYGPRRRALWCAGGAMASLFTHLYTGAVLGWGLGPAQRRGQVLALGAACAALPDADVWGWYAGIEPRTLLGHRGFTHSLSFALLWAALLTAVLRRHWPEPGAPRRLFWLGFAATASHGLFDAMTYGGGHGVALFAPWTAVRVHLPWRPVLVAPLGVQNFFSDYGWRVLQSELLWLWLPVTVLVLAWRRWGRRAPR